MTTGRGEKKPTAVSELLTKSQGMLERLREGVQAADRTLATVRGALPRELAERVWAAQVEGTTLDIAVDSAAFASRIRYLETELRSAVVQGGGTPISRCRIRVRPRG
jgi:hypothetical protein